MHVSLGATVAAVLALAACDGGTGFRAGEPPGGGPPSGMIPGPDAGPDNDGGGPATITGFVCDVADIRMKDACSRLEMDGLEVSIVNTTVQTTTDVAGRFSLPTPPGVNAVILAVRDPAGQYHTGATVVTFAGGGASQVRVPVVDQRVYEAILLTSAVAVAPGNGVVVVNVRRQGAPVAGAIIGELDGTSPLYDGAADPLLFTGTPPTGVTGTAIWFDVPASARSEFIEFTVTVNGDAPVGSETVVVGNALLFTTVTLPAN